MDKRKIILIDGIVLLFSLTFIFVLYFNLQPQIQSPISGFAVSDSVLFSFSKGNALIIDENPDFSSPRKIIVEDEIVVNLKPGFYYWKVEGPGNIFDSAVRNFSINSHIDLRLTRVGEGFEVANAGNTELEVEVYNKGNLTGNLTLGKGRNDKIDGDSVLGREYD
jgi:hypothetical protein